MQIDYSFSSENIVFDHASNETDQGNEEMSLCHSKNNPGISIYHPLLFTIINVLILDGFISKINSNYYKFQKQILLVHMMKINLRKTT